MARKSRPKPAHNQGKVGLAAKLGCDGLLITTVVDSHLASKPNAEPGTEGANLG
jgi:hypothetical protein